MSWDRLVGTLLHLKGFYIYSNPEARDTTHLREWEAQVDVTPSASGQGPGRFVR